MGKNKERSFDRQMEYLEGLYGRDQPQSGRTTGVSINSNGLIFVFGRRDFDFVLWEDIVAVDFVGSTNPAFKSVSKAVYGFPGLQSISSKEVRTGAKTFMTVSYTGVVKQGGNKRVAWEGTVRFYVKDCSHNDLEVELAKYMHLVEKNAERLAKKIEEKSQKNKPKGKSVSDNHDADKSKKPTFSEELKDLVKMLDRGLLTESEFQQAKKKLLKNK